MKKCVPRRRVLLGLTTAGVSCMPMARSQEPVRASSTGDFSVIRFGARRDGVNLDTSAIQAAIDSCSKAGGGTVSFPPGRYLSGTLFLRSHVRLFLDTGSVLLGSRNLQDYPVTVPATRSYTDNYCDKALLYGENLEDVALEGGGRIDGQGTGFEGPYKRRPFIIRMVNCRSISVSGLTLADSPMWVQHYLACREVGIRGITVRSRVRPNNDGIDIDGCEQVRISDCDISSGDDAIVLKTTSGHACRNVAITNCLLSTACNALKVGTETNGSFENIVISNCAVYDTGLSGISLLIVDGGSMERVSISGITMNRVGTPLFIRLGDRGRPIQAGGDRPPAGKLGNILISNLQADNADPLGSAVTGLPDSPLEQIALENIRVRYRGGGKLAGTKIDVPELAAEYPEHKMFGRLPAYGLYCRHVNNLRLHNVNLDVEEPDLRSGIFCEDVQELEIGSAVVEASRNGASPIWFRQVKRAFLHGCRVLKPVKSYLRIEGDRTERINLFGNDLGPAEEIAALGSEVSREKVFLDGAVSRKDSR